MRWPLRRLRVPRHPKFRLRPGGNHPSIYFVGILFLILLFLALVVFASPLLAVLIALPLGVAFLVGMALLRRVSIGTEPTRGTPTHGPTRARPRGTEAGASTGAPASGEG
jgi:hypothetical protein